MKLITCSEDEDHAYLIPIGDLHVGDKSFGRAGREKLKGYLSWVLEHSNARIFLMGDIYNVASRVSKTSPFDNTTSEYQEAIELFRPVKAQIIGAITGNHERRMEDMFGFNPLIPFCAELGIPYLGISAIIKFKVGLRPHKRSGVYNNTYYLYAHHSTGGGSTLGGAINRSVKLQEIVQGVDAYLIGHNHQLSTGFREVFEPAHTRIIKRRVIYITCGSYLDYENSYAEAGMFPSGKLGSPRLRLSGLHRKKDIHCSL